MKKKFTDNQLALLAVELRRDYDALIRKRGMTAAEIYKELLNRIHGNLNNEESTLNDLPPEEQEKVYTVLNTVFQSTGSYGYVKGISNLLVFREEDLTKKTNLHPSCLYCATTDAVFTWAMLDMIKKRRNDIYGLDNGNSSNDYDDILSRVEESNSTKNGDDLGSLFFVGIVVAAGALTFVALYYIISQTLNSMERFWYDEGWLQASIALATMVAAGSASGLLAGFLLAAPFATLAFAIGLSNPVSVIIIGTVCLSIIGAAGSWFITKQIQDYVIKKSNPDALDPKDPHRFTLTAEEEANLSEKGMDPLKVKCAMVAIREEMGKKQVPSLLQRLTFSREKQEYLNEIRKLRRGEVEDKACFKVGFLVEFDLRPFETKPVNSDDYSEEDDLSSEEENLSNSQSVTPHASYDIPGGNSDARYVDELRNCSMGSAFY